MHVTPGGERSARAPVANAPRHDREARAATGRCRRLFPLLAALILCLQPVVQPVALAGSADSLQSAIDTNPFLQRFGFDIDVVDLADGFAMLEITDGPPSLVQQIASGATLENLDPASLATDEDRQALTALRKVLDVLSEREELAAVMLMANEVEGAADVAQPAPEPEPEPSAQAAASTTQTAATAQPAAGEGMDQTALVRSVQSRLNELGYGAGTPDGVPGRNTRSAIERYQLAAGLPVDGQPTGELLAHMNSDAAVRSPTPAAPASGGPPVMAVWEFSKAISYCPWWGPGVGWDLADLVTNELAASGNFRLVERQHLAGVLSEQNLAQSGRISAGTGARIGQIVGARYLVMGSLASYEEDVKGTGGGISFAGISIGGKKGEAYLAIDLRVVDTTTGEIVQTRTVEARTSDYGIRLGVFKGGFGGNLAHAEDTPAGKAIRAVVIEISEYLECAMIDRGSCMAEFDRKEQQRRDSNRGTIKLDN